MTLHAIELAYSSKSGALAEGCNITMTEWCRKRKGIILTVVARCCLHNSRDGPCHLSICIHSHRISSGIRNNSWITPAHSLLSYRCCCYYYCCCRCRRLHGTQWLCNALQVLLLLLRLRGGKLNESAAGADGHRIRWRQKSGGCYRRRHHRHPLSLSLPLPAPSTHSLVHIRWSFLSSFFIHSFYYE